MSFQDRSLNCSDCGNGFTFTSGEQEFHAGKGFTTTPGRCPTCRTARRAQRGEGPSGSYAGSRQLFTAKCATCGHEARVPFQPRSDRPIYCSDCFRSHRSGDRAGFAGRNAH